MYIFCIIMCETSEIQLRNETEFYCLKSNLYKRTYILKTMYTELLVKKVS